LAIRELQTERDRAKHELELERERARHELDARARHELQARCELQTACEREKLELQMACEREKQELKEMVHAERQQLMTGVMLPKWGDIDKAVARLTGVSNAVEQLTDAVKKLPAVTVPVCAYPRVEDAQIRGSMSRAKAWVNATQHANSKVDAMLPPPRNQNRTTLAIVHGHAEEQHQQDERRQLEERLAQALGNHARPEEKDIHYADVVDLLGQYFAALSCPALGDLHVLDTHRQRFLADLSPDLVLQRYSNTQDKFNIAAVIDLKGIGDEGYSKLDTANNLGQILDYLTAMQQCQLGRGTFLGLVTNLQDACLLRYQTKILKGRSRRTSGNEPYTSKLTQYRKVPLQDALRYLYQVLQDPAANPPRLPFSESAGELSHVVQRHSKSVVAVFHRQNTQIIVKAAPEEQWNSGVENEIMCLKHLQGDDRPSCIPKLVYDNMAENASPLPEFGISPVGRPLQLELFKEATDFRICLEDILVALKWVHDHGIVHRDVRGDNIIVFEGLDVGEGFLQNPDEAALDPRNRRRRALLIDFDRAISLGSTCYYEGGYICCPRDLLQRCTQPEDQAPESPVEPMVPLDTPDEDEEMRDIAEATVSALPIESSSALAHTLYTTEKSHDYLSFVLLLNTSIFPFTLQGYTYQLVEVANSLEQRRLLKLWDELEAKEPWASLVMEAKRAQSDIQVWRQLLGMIVWL